MTEEELLALQRRALAGDRRAQTQLEALGAGPAAPLPLSGQPPAATPPPPAAPPPAAPTAAAPQPAIQPMPSVAAADLMRPTDPRTGVPLDIVADPLSLPQDPQAQAVRAEWAQQAAAPQVSNQPIEREVHPGGPEAVVPITTEPAPTTGGAFAPPDVTWDGTQLRAGVILPGTSERLEIPLGPNEATAGAALERAQLEGRLTGVQAQALFAGVHEFLAGGTGAGGPSGAFDVRATTTLPIGGQVDPRLAAQLAAAQAMRRRGEMGAGQAEVDTLRTRAQAAAQMGAAGEEQAAERFAEQKDAQQELRARVARVDQLLDSVADGTVDPNRFFGRNAGAAITAGIAVALGRLGNTLAGQAPNSPNAALGVINGIIDRDIRAQEQDLANRRAAAGLAQTGLAQFRNLLGDEQAARDAYRAAMLRSTEGQLNRQILNAQGDHLARLHAVRILVEQERMLAEQAAAQARPLGQATVTSRVRTDNPAGALRQVQQAAGRLQAPPPAPPARPPAAAAPAAPGAPQEAQEAINVPGSGQAVVRGRMAELARRNPAAAQRALRQQAARDQAQQERLRRSRPGAVETIEYRRLSEALAAAAAGRPVDLTWARLNGPSGQAVARLMLSSERGPQTLRAVEERAGALHDISEELRAVHQQLLEGAGVFPSRLRSRVLTVADAARRIYAQNSNMGVIQEFEQARLERLIPNPGDLRNQVNFNNWVRGFNESLVTLEEVLRREARILSAAYASFGYTMNSIVGVGLAQAGREGAERMAEQGRAGAIRSSPEVQTTEAQTREEDAPAVVGRGGFEDAVNAARRILGGGSRAPVTQ